MRSSTKLVEKTAMSIPKKSKEFLKGLRRGLEEIDSMIESSMTAEMTENSPQRFREPVLY